MKVDYPRIGSILAVICIAILIAASVLPLWTIDRRDTTRSPGYEVYLNSTHEFKLFGVSTHHKHTSPLGVQEDRLETSYFEVDDSDLALHFTAMAVMVILAAVFIVLILILNRLPQKRSYRLIALALGFLVVFLSLGSASYLNVFVPSAVGNSRDSLATALRSPGLPDIGSFADSEITETVSETMETTWGPSIGWYLFFIACVVMLFAIWFLESRPRTREEESED